MHNIIKISQECSAEPRSGGVRGGVLSSSSSASAIFFSDSADAMSSGPAFFFSTAAAVHRMCKLGVARCNSGGESVEGRDEDGLKESFNYRQ